MVSEGALAIQAANGWLKPRVTSRQGCVPPRPAPAEPRIRVLGDAGFFGDRLRSCRAAAEGADSARGTWRPTNAQAVGCGRSVSGAAAREQR